MMKRMWIRLAAVLGIVLSMAAACPVNPTTSNLHTHPLTPAPIAIEAEAREVVTLINEQRIAAGCPGLRINGSMVAFADAQAKFMDNGGGLVHSRLGDPIFAENLSQGYPTAREVVNAWLDSDVHRRNILNCSYTDTGAAFSGQFAVQVFGNA